MSILVTGSAGHLGEGLMRTLRGSDSDVFGVDLKASEYTDAVGSIADPEFVRTCMEGRRVVYHAATLHKPHVVTHSKQDFVDTNVSGTLTLLEAAVEAGVEAFVFTSTTSLFGAALRPPPGQPAAWVTEELKPVPRNIYGVTKAAAEDLCHLFHRTKSLDCVVLRTSRFFPEDDDSAATREQYVDDNVKASEFLHRRVDLEDVVSAHLLAAERAPSLGFGVYIVTATTPFLPEDLETLNTDARSVVARRVPQFVDVYERLGWKMFETIDRVYVNAAARRNLGWEPKYDFASILDALAEGRTPGSDLARAVGAKGYHEETFEDGPFPVE